MAICHECNGHGCLADGPVCRVCKGTGTNGVDLSIDKGREAAIARDLAPKFCGKRIGNGVWCVRTDGHDNECRNQDAEAVYGPLEAKPSMWRKHKGQIQPRDPKPAQAKPAEPAAELIK